jgi:hypothetical protein
MTETPKRPAQSGSGLREARQRAPWIRLGRQTNNFGGGILVPMARSTALAGC